MQSRKGVSHFTCDSKNAIDCSFLKVVCQMSKAVQSVATMSHPFIHTISHFLSPLLSIAHTNRNPLFTISEDEQIRKRERWREWSNERNKWTLTLSYRSELILSFNWMCTSGTDVICCYTIGCIMTNQHRWPRWQTDTQHLNGRRRKSSFWTCNFRQRSLYLWTWRMFPKANKKETVFRDTPWMWHQRRVAYLWQNPINIPPNNTGSMCHRGLNQSLVRATHFILDLWDC